MDVSVSYKSSNTKKPAGLPKVPTARTEEQKKAIEQAAKANAASFKRLQDPIYQSVHRGVDGQPDLAPTPNVAPTPKDKDKPAPPSLRQMAPPPAGSKPKVPKVPQPPAPANANVTPARRISLIPIFPMSPKTRDELQRGESADGEHKDAR